MIAVVFREKRNVVRISKIPMEIQLGTVCILI